ncbi:glycosyltransferase family 4 protein [Claveliimonas bilis]|uniref:glycosyltransferase family 4 protein n=1 Tax=Claveliimonas bilis TaxID=3028070 RepID=UPI00292D0C61|nr:glycosyltransferase family 4 protein [Claveliimonas bilis]BDZ81829.1 hypothetical protein Lac3_30380 [Claveliimonas bilis]
MKVLIIDPWGTDNTAEYLNGLIYSVSRYVDVTVYTNYGFALESNCNCTVVRKFFKHSDNLKDGKYRKIIRGLEYIKSYMDIVRLVMINRYDVIHINWLLMYKIDKFFLRVIKLWCKNIVYTAHNVVPHLNGEKFISDLKTIYSLVDKIIVHGDCIKKEFNTYFPENMYKVFIQHHGANLRSKNTFDKSLVDGKIVSRVEGAERVYICFGKQFYNKGTDRLIKIWNESSIKSLLVVAGKINEEYTTLKEQIKNCDNNNIVILDYYIDDNTLSYLIDRSSVILLPYRHASMSGVVFTAADFKKTILTTNVGSILEYLHPGEDSVVCGNNIQEIQEAIIRLETNTTNDDLALKGRKLRENIEDNFSWENMGNHIVNDIYKA